MGSLSEAADVTSSTASAASRGSSERSYPSPTQRHFVADGVLPEQIRRWHVILKDSSAFSQENTHLADVGDGGTGGAGSSPIYSSFVILDGRSLAAAAQTSPGLGTSSSRGGATDSVPVLTLDRHTGLAEEVRWGGAQIQELIDGGGDRWHVYAVLGSLCVDVFSGLLVVTGAKRVCTIEGKEIYEVTAVDHLPLATGNRGKGGGEGPRLCDGVLNLLSAGGFYFSMDFDITRTLQWKTRRALGTAGHSTSTQRRWWKSPVCGGGGFSGGGRGGCHRGGVHRNGDAEVDRMALADRRFVWNRCLVRQLTRQKGVSSRWFLPLMQGYIGVSECWEPLPADPSWDQHLTLVLISRRGTGRAGTRYSARGVDDQGDVGNLVETEQLVHIDIVEADKRPRFDGESPDSSSLICGRVLAPKSASSTSSVVGDEGSSVVACADRRRRPVGCKVGWLSLVQVRGSVPVFWEQSPQGPIQLTRAPTAVEAIFERQHRELEATYGGYVFYANLLTERNASEQQLTKAFEHQLFGRENEPTIRRRGDLYCHFDFHARVLAASRADLDRELDALWQEIGPFVTRSGFLDGTRRVEAKSGESTTIVSMDVEATASPVSMHEVCEPARWQVGVLRTNCLDCLDRTNVVQFYVVWRWIRDVCSRCGGLPSRAPAQAVAVIEPRGAEVSASQNGNGGSLVFNVASSLRDGAAMLLYGLGLAVAIGHVSPLPALAAGDSFERGDAGRKSRSRSASGTEAELGDGDIRSGSQSKHALRSRSRSGSVASVGNSDGPSVGGIALNATATACNVVTTSSGCLQAEMPALRLQLQQLWADQGDRVSHQYTGAAGSSMSSLLREGHQSSYSVLERSWYGITRAYQAKFQDAQRQEFIDTLLGLHDLHVDLPFTGGSTSSPMSVELTVQASPKLADRMESGGKKIASG